MCLIPIKAVKAKKVVRRVLVEKVTVIKAIEDQPLLPKRQEKEQLAKAEKHHIVVEKVVAKVRNNIKFISSIIIFLF